MNRVTVENPEQELDRPPPTDVDTVEGYVAERTAELDAEVLQGIRELEGAESIRWSVYRVGEEDEKRNGFLAKIATSQMTSDYLRDKFGAGRYYVRGTYPNGKYATHRKFEVASDAPRKPIANANDPVTPPANAFDVQRFLTEQELREEARSEKRRRERNELLAIIVPAMGPVVAALLGRSGPDITGLVAALKPAPPPDPIQMIAALKQLSPQVEQNQPTAIESAFKIIDRLKDLSPGEGGTSWLDVFKELARSAGPTLGTMIEGAVVRASSSSAVPGVSSPSVAVLPSSVPGAVPTADGSSAMAVPAATLPRSDPMFGMLALVPWLKTQLEMCLQKAARGSDPGLIAERLIDDLPDGVKPEQLLELIARADWWQQMQRFDARVAAYGPWFARMREAILEQFNVTARAESVGGVPSSITAPQTTVGPSPRDSMTITEVKPEPDRPSGEAPKLGL